MDAGFPEAHLLDISKVIERFTPLSELISLHLPNYFSLRYPADAKDFLCHGAPRVSERGDYAGNKIELKKLTIH